MARSWGSGCVVLAAVLVSGFGCAPRNLVDDPGGGSAGTSGSAGRSGTAGFTGVGPAIDANLGNLELLGDFSLETVARLNLTGTPERNGIWYSYNDASPTCLQAPTPPGFYAYRPSTPPTQSPGPSGGLALHATWNGCVVWGAGIGVDLRLLESSDGSASSKLPYDLTPYRGITFLALATPGSNTRLRFKVVMRAETPIRDGGGCNEAVVGVNKCSDSWGQLFTLPGDGTWQQVVVLFADNGAFKQEGWGALFDWDPTDVFGIQIQSQGSEIDEAFDFWIDDLYLIR